MTTIVSIVSQATTTLTGGSYINVNAFSTGHVALYGYFAGASVSLNLTNPRDLAAKLVAAADAADAAVAAGEVA